MTGIDPWFLDQLQQIVDLEKEMVAGLGKDRTDAASPGMHRLEARVAGRRAPGGRDLQAPLGRPTTPWLREPSAWASPTRAWRSCRQERGGGARARKAAGIVPVYKRVDTCAAEFESFTPYLYSTYESECEAAPTDRKKVVILGSGPEPHRPGHRVRLLLLPRRLRVQGRGLRDHHGQLQPGDGLDRLRHLGPPLLRAPDVRGRDERASRRRSPRAS